MQDVTIESSWMGAFSPVALTNILKRVANESRSGELKIVSGNWVKTVRVDDGAVRFAQSNMRQDRLGESMLAHDCITKKDYRLASERMVEDGCRFGEALLKLGTLDRKQLHRELGVQVQRIVLSLFRVSEGLYSFEEVETPPTQASRLPFSLSVPPLLLKGLRRIEDGRLILSALPPADTTVRLARRPGFNFDLGKLAPVERTVLEKASARTTIGEIVRDESLERSAALRACYALLTLGLLEIDAQMEDQVEQPEPETVEAVLVPESSSQTTAEVEVDVGQRETAELAHVAEAANGDDDDRDDPEALARARRAEQLERDARLHLQVKDWNGAISLLHELVAIVPENAEYQMMLGQALQFHPTLAKSAEDHFVYAVELAPTDPRVHVALGRYYQRVKKQPSAIAHLERALELDPQNADAKRYLEHGRQPTKMSRLMKRIFG